MLGVAETKADWLINISKIDIENASYFSEIKFNLTWMQLDF